MRARLSIAFLLLGWLASLAVLAAAASIGIVIAAMLLWPVAALGVAVWTVIVSANRRGVARWAVLVPGLLGSALIVYGVVTDAQDTAAVVYYIALIAWLVALIAWLIALIAAHVTKGGDPAA